MIERSAERYILSDNRDEIYYEHILRYRFAEDFINGKEVLDVACGSGYGSYHLANNGAKFVIGVDVSEEIIDYCKKHYQRKNLAYAVMNATALKFPNNDFDIIISFETIEHIKNYNLFLSELKRVLKPNGILFISTPNKKVYGKLGEDAHKFHVKEFYLNEFKKLISRHFVIQKLYGQRRSEYCKKEVASLEGLIISEKNIKNAKFFICAAKKHEF